MINNARMTDIQALYTAGIDPKTRLPLKAVSGGANMMSAMTRLLRVVDEQDAVNRYVWYNLPGDLDGQLIERILYYKGQGMFFYMPENESFMFLPYALDGTIDVYGRYTGVTPLPFNGSAGTPKDGKITPWVVGLKRKPVYEVRIDDMQLSDYTESCVLLHDYSKQISQTVLPRQALNDPLLVFEATMLPYMRTALLNSTGVQGLKVSSEDEQSDVTTASESVDNAALEGRKWIPVVGKMDFQDLAGGEVAKAEEFLMAMQAIDNFRLGLYGLDNGGLFQKKAHSLQTENDLNQGNTGLIMQDGLTIRQNFCNIVNSITALGIWCDVSENATGHDRNMDGVVGDEQMPDDGGDEFDV